MKKAIPEFLDFIGVLLLLFAAIWQFVFTDWFSSQELAHHVFVSDEMTYNLLVGIGRLSDQMAVGKPADGRTIHDQMAEAVSQAIERRDSKRLQSDPQSHIFSGIRAFLFVLGSGGIVVGKFLSYHRARKNAIREAEI